MAIQRDLGGDSAEDIVSVSQPFASRHGFLTANDVTPYVFGARSCAEQPMVFEVPPVGAKAAFFGSIVDAWQVPITDVGEAGPDAGKGGKYLFIPPGYSGEVPDGYFVFRPWCNTVHFAFRPVAKNGGTVEDQVEYARSLRVYPLSQAENPPANSFLDAFPQPFRTLPVYDWTYFTDLNTVFQREPVREMDKTMVALLASLGIRKGEDFNPDEETRQAMLDGLERAWMYLQGRFTADGGSFALLWDDRQWRKFNISPVQAKQGFPFVNEEQVLIDERAQAYFYLTYLPKSLGSSTFYLCGLRDAAGELLRGDATYRLRIPADTPAEDFWSVIVYSMASKGFVADVDRVGLSSRETDAMQVNEDGSVDVYFAPSAPEGWESNWIPTGEDFFLLFRLYGPGATFFDGSWRLAEIERMP